VIGLIQRVREARVEVGGRTVGAIGPGLLVLACAEPADGAAQVERFIAKILKLRIFSDEAGKMNRSVQDIDGAGTAGGLLIVSQFTLAADTSGGNRPSFTAPHPPNSAGRYERLLARATEHPQVAAGEFGADMQVHLVNDGPVTIPLRMV
jgi:D-tyrosyl-tRNA(Tyr) deacylase